ncbi:hypothetical protein, partial [Nocardia cyriacigeorgica]|uniref:hypothetical protein n=1 Tax=Nocardia cyriacigeorgica TaxID=135487 RepID=UPI00245583B8
VTATINGTKISVGGPAMLDQHNLDPAPAAAEWSAQGSTVLHVLRDGNRSGPSVITTGPVVWRVPGLRATAGSRPRKYPESRR